MEFKICRHRLELMRHIYNGEGQTSSNVASDSFDKDDGGWSGELDVDTMSTSRGQRWVTRVT